MRFIGILVFLFGCNEIVGPTMVNYEVSDCEGEYSEQISGTARAMQVTQCGDTCSSHKWSTENNVLSFQCYSNLTYEITYWE